VRKNAPARHLLHGRGGKTERAAFSDDR
jgi:hypothetical protein